MSAATFDTSRPTPAVALVFAARPKTLFAGVAPVCVGAVLAWRDGANAPLPVVLALLVALGVQVGTNYFNDWADGVRGTDDGARLGPARATASGWLPARAVLAASLVAFVIAAAAGLVLAGLTDWRLVAVGALSILAGVAYTGGPWPLAYLGLGEPFVLVFFGWVATLGTYVVAAGQWSLTPLLPGTALGLVAVGLLAVNNLRDRHGDARANKRTLVVRLGAAFGRWEYTLALVAAFAAVGLAALREGQPSWLLGWVAAPLAWREIRGVFANDGASLNRHLAGTARIAMVMTLGLAVGVFLGGQSGSVLS